MAIMHDRIKELRHNSGMTLAQISDKLNVTEATAQRYESGKGIKTIPYEVIEKYANIFNCTPQYIMGWADQEKEKPTISSERERKILKATELLQEYSEEDLLWVIQMLEKMSPNKK